MSRQGFRPTQAATSGEEAAWRVLLAARRGASLARPPDLDGPARLMFDLYAPYVAVPAARPYAVAHLAQSLDGRIATVGGASRWISGEADLLHCHRMRALADAVVVGAETVRRDDPQLTVRRCAGANPVRVVLDPRLSLCRERQVVREAPESCLIVATAETTTPDPPGVEVLRLPSRDGELDPHAIRAALARRGLTFLYIEGGGRTVSRFLAARALERLQLVVSPVILGSGRPSLALPEIGSVEAGLRPRTRRFELGEDVLFECILDE